MPSTRIGRIASTLTAMLHTRLDLIRVELEEELLRFSSYFMYAFIALFCGGVAVSCLLVLILVLFWEAYRVQVLVSFIVIFGAMSMFIFAWLKKQMSNKPHLLEQSIAEFKKDTDLFRAYKQHTDQESDQQNSQGLS